MSLEFYIYILECNAVTKWIIFSPLNIIWFKFEIE